LLLAKSGALACLLIALGPLLKAQDSGSRADLGTTLRANGEVPGATLLPDFEPGKGTLTFQLGFYNHSDAPGDGNPFLDEELTVIEPVLILDHDVSENFGYSVELSYDFVSSASIGRLDAFPDQTGASRDNYIGGDFSFRHRMDNDAQFTWHVGYSDEYDYDSLGVGASYAWQPRGTDATVSVGLDAYLDDITLISGVDGTENGSDDRLSLTLNANWYQILSPKTHGEFGVSLAQQDGYLGTPYNFVVLEDGATVPNPPLHNGGLGMLVDETLPDSRTRLAVFGRVRSQIETGRAWQLGSRLYADSWDILSASLEPSYYHALSDDWTLELSYRFYAQTAADDFEESFTAPNTEPFRTQDSDLGSFSSHTVGFAFDWMRNTNSTIYTGINYQLRSDGLDHFYGFIGWSKAIF